MLPLRPALAALVFITASATTRAVVKLPHLLSDHAVLRASEATHIWGWAAPGEPVSVTLADQKASVQADATGHWQVALDLYKTGAGPFELTVKGATNELKVSDVVIGEVWLASGQSNMDFSLRDALEAQEELARPENPQLRFFKCPQASLMMPKEDVEGKWMVIGPGTAGGMSAVAYYFARQVHAELKVPLGILQSDWGGSSVEAWISPQALETVPELKTARERQWALMAKANLEKKAFDTAVPAWLKAHQREDRASDATAFAATSLDASNWVPVKMSAPISAPGLPATGAFWVRRVVEVPAKLVGTRLIMRGQIDGIADIYWNGRLARPQKIKDYSGNSVLYLSLSPEEVQKSANVIALRFYAPMTLPKINAALSLAGQDLAEGWVAKAEYALPDPANLPPPPQITTAPPQTRENPGALFNGMIAPFLPATFSGILWYQGETNASRAWSYRTSFPLLIQDWRAQLKQGDLPFYFCQLSNFRAKEKLPTESDWAELREAQTLALKLPQTGQAVLLELGEADDIHPLNKGPAGDRLARLALAQTYGKKDVVFSGPVYASHEVRDGKITVRFSHAEGLHALPLPATYDVSRLRHETAPLLPNRPGSEVQGFQICGADQKWVWADAKIDAENVVVSNPEVPAPTALRYAWANNPTVNLINAAKLPAAPFRTDDFPATTRAAKP